MKAYILVVDKLSKRYQSGMIDEPIVKDKTIVNALAHFGIVPESVIFTYKDSTSFVGYSEGTSWIFSGHLL